MIRFEESKTYSEESKRKHGSKYSPTIQIVKRTAKMVQFIYTEEQNPKTYRAKIRIINDLEYFFTENGLLYDYFYASDTI